MDRVESADAGSHVTVNRGSRNVFQPLEIAEGAPEYATKHKENDGKQDDHNENPWNDYRDENDGHCHSQNIVNQRFIRRW